MAVERQPIDKINTRVQLPDQNFVFWRSADSLLQTALQSLKTARWDLTTHLMPAFFCLGWQHSSCGHAMLNVTKLAQAQSLVAVGQASALQRSAAVTQR